MSYPRLAGRLREIIGQPALTQKNPTLMRQLQKEYIAPPNEVISALELAAPKLGTRIVTDPDLDVLGEMTHDGTLLLSPRVVRSKARTIAHELGHWEMAHRNAQDVPIWQTELEAEAISHDVMNRLVPNLADQHTNYSANWISHQIWNPYREDPVAYLQERTPLLQTVSDRIIRIAGM